MSTLELGPAREALLADARRDAEQLLTAADAEVAALLADAGRDAAALVAEARSAGTAEGTASAQVEAAHARTLARWQVLAAQRTALERLRARVRSEALALRDEPGYSALLERTTAVVRQALGTDAEIEIDPRGVGGARGRAAGRMVDCTLPTLADRCLDALGPAVERLWR